MPIDYSKTILQEIAACFELLLKPAPGARVADLRQNSIGWIFTDTDYSGNAYELPLNRAEGLGPILARGPNGTALVKPSLVENHIRNRIAALLPAHIVPNLPKPIRLEVEDPGGMLCVDHLSIIRAAVTADTAEKPKGVSMKEALAILNDQDPGATDTQYKRVMKLKDRPAALGKSENHSQIDLYEPSPLADWIEKKEGYLPLSKKQFTQRLMDIAKPIR